MTHGPQVDSETACWLEELRSEAATRERALGRLRAMLLGVTRGEAFRRRASLPPELSGDLDDLCAQAANDALLSITAKLDGFRGESRFTTWAFKFAILEISSRLRRRSWHGRRIDLDEPGWGRLADARGGPSEELERDQVAAAVRRAISETLTPRQRSVFLAVVVEEVPLDVLAERMGSSRGSLYKIVHDARTKLRQALAAGGLSGQTP